MCFSLPIGPNTDSTSSPRTHYPCHLAEAKVCVLMMVGVGGVGRRNGGRGNRWFKLLNFLFTGAWLYTQRRFSHVNILFLHIQPCSFHSAERGYKLCIVLRIFRPPTTATKPPPSCSRFWNSHNLGIFLNGRHCFITSTRRASGGRFHCSDEKNLR